MFSRFGSNVLSFFLRLWDGLEARECVLREWSGGLASTKGRKGILGAVFSIAGRLGGFLGSGMPGSVMRHLGNAGAYVQDRRNRNESPT